MASILKYRQGDFDPVHASTFDDSLHALVFEMDQMVNNTRHGQGIIAAICYIKRSN